MSYSTFPVLSLITFLPVLGVLFILFINKNSHNAIRHTAFGISVLTFLVSLPLFFGFKADTHEMQFVEKVSWIKDWGVNYFVGIDGISLFLVLLTTFLTAISVLSSYSAITDKVKEYMICMLLLETGMVGVFVAIDMFLFYVFWEVMLIPMYLLIGVWGGPRRIYAAVKFFLYTMFGSVLMLVAILVVYFMYKAQAGVYTFNLFDLYNTAISKNAQYLLFGAFALAFAIKVPMFPFHTWLPDAHVEAPTAGSVILAGVLLKMGTYGFIRFAMPLFPVAAVKAIPIISILAIVGIIYGALVAMVQDDIKKLVAYSSVSHLGFVMLGLFALNTQGVQGGMLQMINHGLSTGALFLIVGMIYERRHTRLIADFGGISKVMPWFATFFMIVTLSSIGLPGLNGFVGEFLILLGTFKSNIIYAVIASTGIIFAAVYMLWMFQRVMFGEVKNPKNQALADLNLREWAVLVPIIVLIVWIGLYPNTFLSRMEVSVNHFIKHVDSKYTAHMKEITAMTTTEKR